MPALRPVSSPTRAASSSTAVHSCLLTPANRSGTAPAAENAVRRVSSATPWNKLTAGSSRLIGPARCAYE
jgi:hypothetical protein